ncbi:MAG: sulfotransferase [Chromatiales bacterium]|nr:sulfotransferase [Chromatiales bacterium]
MPTEFCRAGKPPRSAVSNRERRNTKPNKDKTAEASKPNFFIVGSMKSGTSTLYEYLSVHPQIFMSPVKEPSYFVDRETLEQIWPDMAEMGFWRGEEYYLDLFKDADQHIAIGEASTNYAKLPRVSGVAERIATFAPEAKIIFMMRDPVERNDQPLLAQRAQLCRARLDRRSHLWKSIHA